MVKSTTHTCAYISSSVRQLASSLCFIVRIKTLSQPYNFSSYAKQTSETSCQNYLDWPIFSSFHQKFVCSPGNRISKAYTSRKTSLAMTPIAAPIYKVLGNKYPSHLRQRQSGSKTLRASQDVINVVVPCVDTVDTRPGNFSLQNGNHKYMVLSHNKRYLSSRKTTVTTLIEHNNTSQVAH
ncbi:hypothetical protein ACMFMG_000443 [Clarireedia jacksonii]